MFFFSVSLNDWAELIILLPLFPSFCKINGIFDWTLWPEFNALTISTISLSKKFEKRIKQKKNMKVNEIEICIWRFVLSSCNKTTMSGSDYLCRWARRHTRIDTLRRTCLLFNFHCWCSNYEHSKMPFLCVFELVVVHCTDTIRYAYWMCSLWHASALIFHIHVHAVHITNLITAWIISIVTNSVRCCCRSVFMPKCNQSCNTIVIESFVYSFMCCLCVRDFILVIFFQCVHKSDQLTGSHTIRFRWEWKLGLLFSKPTVY